MKLNCHCENIEIRVENQPADLTTCNCSSCHRYGALWGYYKPEDVGITIGASGACAYSWGDKNIEFVHCRRCGCMTHYQTPKASKEPKLGLNFRMADSKAIASILIRQFDGADTWQYLD